MTLEGWRLLVANTASDPELAELTARVLNEQDEAKQRLRDKGYGWTGLSILKTVELVPDASS